MKLWLLRPIKIHGDSLWNQWYDKAFGFVVRANTEQEARELANEESGDEVYDEPDVWLKQEFTLCEELTTQGESEVILRDFRQV